MNEFTIGDAVRVIDNSISNEEILFLKEKGIIKDIIKTDSNNKETKYVIEFNRYPKEVHIFYGEELEPLR